jgi:CRP-like cAMP-binding protein
MATFENDLQRVGLFSDLSQRQLKKLSHSFRERSFKPGTSMITEGKMSGCDFFIITEGAASVSVNGKEVEQLGPGDHFGELALITEQVRTATVTATTRLDCLLMASWDFRKFIKANPDTAWKLLQHLTRVLLEAQNTSQSNRSPASLTR